MTVTEARRATSRLRRLENLDGVRAIAIISVVAYHLTMPGALAGRLGVDVFFPLSGFLITGLLLRELDRSGHVRLRTFYARRLLRLYPALAVTVALTLCFRDALYADVQVWGRSAGLALSYLTNVAIGTGHHSANDPLSPTWSLALEEQFYLLWPLVLIGLLRVLPSRRHVAYAAGLMVVASWTRLGTVGGYFMPDARVGGLLIGCATALYLHGRTIDPAVSSRLCRVSFALAVPAIAFASVHSLTSLGDEVGIPLMGIATALAIPRLIQPGGSIRLLSHPAMVWIGERSYGLYLLHYPVLRAVQFTGVRRGSLALAVATAVIVLPLAALMYRVVEQPTLAWRDRRLSTATT